MILENIYLHSFNELKTSSEERQFQLFKSLNAFVVLTYFYLFLYSFLFLENLLLGYKYSLFSSLMIVMELLAVGSAVAILHCKINKFQKDWKLMLHLQIIFIVVDSLITMVELTQTQTLMKILGIIIFKEVGCLYYCLFIFQGFSQSIALMSFETVLRITFMQCSVKDGSLLENGLWYLPWVMTMLLIVYIWHQDRLILFNQTRLALQQKENSQKIYCEFLEAFSESLIIVSKDEGVIYQNFQATELFGNSFMNISKQICRVPFLEEETSFDISGIRKAEEDRNASSTKLIIHDKSLYEYLNEGLLQPSEIGDFKNVIFTRKKTTESLISYKKSHKLSVSIYSPYYFGNCGKIGIAIKDLSSNKFEEEEEIEDEFRNMFLCTFSHELRTPLNGIIGMLYVLKKENLDKDQKIYLSMALASSLFLMCKIDDILDYAQIENEDFKLENEIVSIRKLLLKIQKACLLHLKEKNVDFFLKISNDVPDVVEIDYKRLRQILINLLSNAIKFTYKGKITLSASVQDESIKFSVKDTGCGISKESMKRLFRLKRRRLSTSKSFCSCSSSLYNGENHKTSELGGLGLTISQKICTYMQSQLSVRSEEGKGTIFSFKIPIQEQRGGRQLSTNFLMTPILQKKQLLPQNERIDTDELEVAKEFQTLENHPSSYPIPLLDITDRNNPKIIGKILVYIVDDVQLNRFVLKSLLKNYNYIIKEACNGAQAVEGVAKYLQKNKYSKIVALMDLEMPIMDGIEATKIIHEIFFSEIPIVVIAITAHAFEKEKAKCRSVGMKRFLTKPITVETTRKLIRYINSL